MTAEVLVASVQKRYRTDTMISACSFLYTLVLFSELSSHSVTVAMPPATVEDEGLGLTLGVEPAVVPPVYRRMDAPDSSQRDGRSKVIVVSVSVTLDLLKTSLSAALFSCSRKIFDKQAVFPNLTTICHMKYYSLVRFTQYNSESTLISNTRKRELHLKNQQYLS